MADILTDMLFNGTAWYVALYHFVVYSAIFGLLWYVVRGVKYLLMYSIYTLGERSDE